MAQMVSIKDTRNKLAEIIDQVALVGDVFVVTKFGKPKAMIIPISKNKLSTSGIEESFGAWVKRNDIKNSKKWAEDLRVKMSSRQ
ncbi:MAG: type II toxin-antitoxin system prevent-host-death family antitoxin [Candidatus Levybacteria bacterium]|nr:type II toxin-antitoxin system prevent-host-death family antitoxin [Candidatus Levybacteria bacterium]